VEVNRRHEAADRLALMATAFSGDKKALKALMEQLTGD
jgi:hypothetical protein